MTKSESGIDQEDAGLMSGLSTTSSSAPAISAGRELDALVAEKVMGWTLRTDKMTVPKYGALGYNSNHGEPVPLYYHGEKYIDFAWKCRFSSDIEAAWKVVEKVDNRNAVAKEMGVLTFSLNRYDNGYTARFFNSGATAETAPLAICLAALKAVGPPDSL